jgi:hypothetical protein
VPPYSTGQLNLILRSEFHPFIPLLADIVRIFVAEKGPYLFLKGKLRGAEGDMHKKLSFHSERRSLANLGGFVCCGL